MTRVKVIQIGLIVFLLGGGIYQSFKVLGLETISAGIAAQSILILIILGWTGSYFFRVFTGRMTFVEQRRRYRESYDRLGNELLKDKFESMSEEEKIQLINELESQKDQNN